jgi:hypothetical protein
MIEKELEFLESKRDNSAGFHLIIAQKWRRFGEPNLFPTPLVYSALDYRMSIERIVFELYALMKRMKYISDEDAKKLEKLTSVITQIMELIGNSKYLYRILKFQSLLIDDDPKFRGKLSVPDINKLKNYWHSLSDYCHMKIKPDNTWLSQDYIKEGYKVLNEVEDYLWEINVEKYFGFFRFETLQPEVARMAEDYVNEIINEDSVRTRLMLMRPVVAARIKK